MQNGWTALMAAVDNNHMDMVKLLLKNGAKTDIADDVSFIRIKSIYNACIYIGWYSPSAIVIIPCRVIYIAIVMNLSSVSLVVTDLML